MTKLHHEILGPDGAPPLLMAGSLGTSLRMWDGQRPLSEHLRLIVFDHRGHGDSPTPPAPYEIANLGQDVLELMDDLGLARASFCGLSLGGMVGMWLAANAPERVDRLVLLCTSPFMPPASAWQERVSAVLAADSVEPIADAVLERWLTPEYAAEHPEVRAELRAMLTSTSPDGYAACCGAIERMDLRGELAGVSAPTLVISGAQDPSTPPQHQELIASSVANSRHEVIDPGAHAVAVEQPEAVNRLILEHLT